MSDVFLSYSRYRQPAEAIAKELQALGITTWLESKDLAPGKQWEEEIRKAMSEARLVAILVGRRSEDAPPEYPLALEHSWSDDDKVLVPILMDDAEPPSFLRHVEAIRVEPRRQDWNRVAKEIAKLLHRGSAIKRSRAAIKEQSERLSLIERGANALREPDDKSAE